MRRRLKLTAAIAALVALVYLARKAAPVDAAFAGQLFAIERLLLALAVIHGIVTVLFNTWAHDRERERAPGIVQNALVLGVFGLVATLAFPGQLLATSAVGAVIMGFAVQDTLSNFFAGLALQIDRPFRPGHWIEVGAFQGRVKEITWRATKIQTKAGNLVIVPNSLIGKDAVSNYSEPIAPTRLFIEVGAGYQHPPNVVREALMTAMRRCGRVLNEPHPDVILMDFAASAITYRARFWVNDFSQDTRACDEVRTAVWYEFNRRQIEIPWPIQIEYSREEAPRETPERRETFVRQLGAVPIFAALPPEGRQALAAAAHERLYARGEAVVAEGDQGASMFLVLDGSVSVVVGADKREVAVTTAGGYFGEMSLLTGDPRTASVIAREDTTVLEISSEAFGAYVRSAPELLSAIANAAASRREHLDAVRAAPSASTTAQPATLLEKMRRFFRLA